MIKEAATVIKTANFCSDLPSAAKAQIRPNLMLCALLIKVPFRSKKKLRTLYRSDSSKVFLREEGGKFVKCVVCWLLRADWSRGVCSHPSVIPLLARPQAANRCSICILSVHKNLLHTCDIAVVMSDLYEILD